MDWGDFWQHVQTYLELAAAALAAGAAIGIPLGIFCRQSLAQHLDSDDILEITKQGYGFFEKTFAMGALAALALLVIPPIAINTDLGFRGVPPAAIDAARGLGMTPRQMFARVEWPLAFPVLFAGVRTAATEVIASAVLAAFIGAGGLGEYITTGLQANQPRLLWLGVASIVAIALAAEFDRKIVIEAAVPQARWSSGSRCISASMSRRSSRRWT